MATRNRVPPSHTKVRKLITMKLSPFEKIEKALDVLWEEAIDEEIDDNGKLHYHITNRGLYNLCESLDLAPSTYEREKNVR